MFFQFIFILVLRTGCWFPSEFRSFLSPPCSLFGVTAAVERTTAVLIAVYQQGPAVFHHPAPSTRIDLPNEACAHIPDTYLVPWCTTYRTADVCVKQSSTINMDCFTRTYRYCCCNVIPRRVSNLHVLGQYSSSSAVLRTTTTWGSSYGSFYAAVAVQTCSTCFLLWVCFSLAVLSSDRHPSNPLSVLLLHPK